MNRNKIRDFYHHQIQNVGIFSVFFNSAYFIRKGIYKGVKKYAPLFNGTIMDFGCGRKPYRELFYNCNNYIGVDIQLSEELLENVTADVFYDGKSIPLPDGSFDHCFSAEAFELISNPDEILKDLYRVLKPNGYFLIIVPFVWEEHWLPFDFCRYSSSGIKKLLERNNFEVLEQSKSTTYFETVWQMQITYVYQNLFPSNKLLKLFLTIIFITPLNMLGIILNLLLPNHKEWLFYHNNVVLARKTT